MKTVLVIPTINPDDRIISLMGDLRARGFERFVVVDDGSDDSHEGIFTALEQQGAYVFHHAANLGKGQAIKTAIGQVTRLFSGITHIITLDDDGQHQPVDVEAVCRAAEEFPESIVLGTRDFRNSDVPARSRIGNAFSAAYFKMDTGMTCHDTQTGLRAIPATLFGLALSTPGSRYDYEMNFLTAAVKSDAPVVMVPIATVYENGNAGSHFSPVRDSLLIYKQFFRFAGSSIMCALVDLGLFALLTATLNLSTALLVALATAVARIASGALNFTLNRQWSFEESGSKLASVRSEAMRYAMLFCFQMLASMVLVTLLSFMPVPLVVVKMIVDGGLFVVSYFVQRNWVFKAPARPQAIIVKGASHARHAQDASNASASFLS